MNVTIKNRRRYHSCFFLLIALVTSCAPSPDPTLEDRLVGNWGLQLTSHDGVNISNMFIHPREMYFYKNREDRKVTIVWLELSPPDNKIEEDWLLLKNHSGEYTIVIGPWSFRNVEMIGNNQLWWEYTDGNGVLVREKHVRL